MNRTYLYCSPSLCSQGNAGAPWILVRKVNTVQRGAGSLPTLVPAVSGRRGEPCCTQLLCVNKPELGMTLWKEFWWVAFVLETLQTHRAARELFFSKKSSKVLGHKQVVPAFAELHPLLPSFLWCISAVTSEIFHPPLLILVLQVGALNACFFARRGFQVDVYEAREGKVSLIITAGK